MIFDMILFYFGARLGIHTIDLGKRTFSETLGGLLIQCRIDKSKLTLRLKVNWDGERGEKIVIYVISIIY